MKSLNIEHRDRFPIKKPVPVPLQLCVDNLGVYNFHSPVADVVHPADPRHWIVGFQCLRDAFRLGYLFYQPRKHFLCLLVNVSKITIQLATGEQRGIQRLAVGFEIASVPLPPDTDVYLSFLRQFQAGKIVVPLQLIPESVFLVVDVLLHFVILQYDCFLPTIQPFRLITKAEGGTSLRSASHWSLFLFNYAILII